MLVNGLYLQPRRSRSPRRPGGIGVLAFALAMFIGLGVATAANAQDSIRLRTTFGDIFVTLTPEAAPATVDNFMEYLTSGDYEDTFFHRSLPGGAGTPQLIEAGRFTFPEDSPTGVVPVRVLDPIVNEFNQSNVRGTISMVLPEGQPDGATNAWFINVANNNEENFGELDGVDGGATVFGTINAAGMEVVDRIAAECTEDLGGDFPEIPLLGDVTGDLSRDQVILITETTEFAGVGAPVSAVLPGSRSIGTSDIATAFATILNPSDQIAASCRIQPITNVPAVFEYFQTDPATNAPIGEVNPEIDIAANGFATLVFSFQPINSFAITEIEFDFSCGNADSPAGEIVGVNTFQLAALGAPGADVVAIVATAGNNGIVDISSATGAGAFAVATTNVGLTETIEVSADTGDASLPVTLLVCETNPTTGLCLSAPEATTVTALDENQTSTFSIFALLSEANAEIVFNPADLRAFVRFTNLSGDVRGSTSVALRTVDGG